MKGMIRRMQKRRVVRVMNRAAVSFLRAATPEVRRFVPMRRDHHAAVFG
jgi:hypothetical protein